ncbi:MAG: ParB/RepB/Spo0J family partition protein [Halopseudomonas sp.]
MSSFQAKKDAKTKASAQKKSINVSAVADKSPKLKVTQAAIPEDQRILIMPSSRFYVDEQVRRYINPTEIQDRAASMERQGQIQPIVVYPADADGRHKIDKGECRWRAAQLLNGFKLKAIIDLEAPKRNKAKRIIGQISENDQRSDLVAIDKAAAIHDLVSEGMTLETIATELGWLGGSGKPNVTKVGRHLSILKLPNEGQRLVSERVVIDLLTLEYLRKINDINPSKFSALCDLAKGDGLTRKRAEQEFKQCKENVAIEGGSGSQIGKAASASPAEIDNALDPLDSETGTSVEANQGAGESVIIPSAKPTNPKPISRKVLVAKTSVHVEVDGHGAGEIWFGDSPEEEGFSWVKLDSGERKYFGVDELRITKVVC